MSDNTNTEVARFIRNETIQKRIESQLKGGATDFTVSLLTVVNNSDVLAKCDPVTVLNAALTASSIKLPINSNLGFAAIVPYYDNYSKSFKAQFQIMWKGFIQLAQNSGQYKTISATPVYEGQIVSNNPLTGIVWDWSVESKGNPVGYAAYFQLLNGFEKTLYMDRSKINAHGEKYSQSYKKDLKDKTKKSLWSTDFDNMALKTVIKQLISKFGPMSTSMQRAIESDQAVITDKGITYIDNESLQEEKGTDSEKKAIIALNKGVEGDPEA